MESWEAPKIQYYEAIRPKHPSDEEVLKMYSVAEQKEILKKQEILSVLAYFIGRDFQMPVLLNTPGSGWHWNFKENHVKVDPKDLLEKPMDYLRFVICHEGGHRRVSRTEFIPEEVWNQTGFPFLMNSIEDPRMNNFVADAYPTFEKYMEFAYEHDFELAEKAREEAKEKLGHTPKHIEAGLEYIRQWFYDRKKEPVEISDHLPEDVKDVVLKTLESARDSWWVYPSKEQADDGEDEISRFAESSYRINLEQIWPEFKKLVEEDKKTQGIGELTKDMKGSSGEGVPQNLKDNLTPEELKALEDVIDEAIKKEKEGKKDSPDSYESDEGMSVPINLDTLPESLKAKLKEYLDMLPDEKKKELEERAEKALKGVSEKVSESIGGQFERDKEKTGETSPPEQESASDESEDKSEQDTEKTTAEHMQELKKAVEEYKKKAEKVIERDSTPYDNALEEVIPIISSLENELRQVFVARRGSHWETGYKFGKKIDIKKRIQEKAKGVSVFDSRSWQKRELPQEKDYAISLLVDLSGSMQGEKIRETFKAIVVLAEVLNRLSIKTEILGFNNKIHEYQNFGEKISEDIRGRIGTMLNEVNSDRARYNDDGWALQEASGRLEKQKDVDQRILVVLSDGMPEESGAHGGPEFELSTIVKKVLARHTQRLIGLGIGSGTGHVSRFYPQSIANVSVDQMAESLAELIKDVIEHPQQT
ncbi:MAG: hypothetical protein RLY49_544 [Candidatus Parcubacteria bacterium]|jgi:hypothetical protein